MCLNRRMLVTKGKIFYATMQRKMNFFVILYQCFGRVSIQRLIHIHVASSCWVLTLMVVVSMYVRWTYIEYSNTVCLKSNNTYCRVVAIFLSFIFNCCGRKWLLTVSGPLGHSGQLYRYQSECIRSKWKCCEYDDITVRDTYIELACNYWSVDSGSLIKLNMW